MDAFHLVAAGWWIGALFALVLAAGLLGGAPLALRRFSRIGYLAVALLIGSGLIKSAILISRPSAISTFAYSWVLLAKVEISAGMGVLAFCKPYSGDLFAQARRRSETMVNAV